MNLEEAVDSAVATEVGGDDDGIDEEAAAEEAAQEQQALQVSRATQRACCALLEKAHKLCSNR